MYCRDGNLTEREIILMKLNLNKVAMVVGGNQPFDNEVRYDLDKN